MNKTISLITRLAGRLICTILAGFLISIYVLPVAPDQDKNAIASQTRNLIPEEQQIKLAESAAPSEISKHATIYVLESKGYIKKRTGTNGFSCLVEHQFLETFEPICYDQEGSATTLQARLFREELRTTGLTEEEISTRIDEAYKAGRFKAPGRPGFAYMLSTENKVFDPDSKKIITAPPHLMFYAPYLTNKDLGGRLGPHMPFLLWEGRPDTFIIIAPTFMCTGDAAKIWQCSGP